jgi:sugar lactone lactonase YvrE
MVELRRPDRVRINARISAGLVAIGIALALAAPAQAASGSFERIWGKDVITGMPDGFEICTVAASCKPGSFITDLGGVLDDPEGIATDAAGNVYVADTGNNRIQKFDSLGNFQRAWGRDVDIGVGGGYEICTVAASCKVGATGGLGGELNNPGGIATDAAGSVYVADTGNNRIQKFDSLGNFQRAWGKDVITSGITDFEICTVAANCKVGSSVTALAGELNFPSGVATDAAGNVYVNDSGANRRIQKFDSLGNFQRAWGKDVDGVAVGTGFEICTVAADCKSGTNGGLGGELNLGDGIATDAGGVYVADTNNHRIQRFDLMGNFQRAWGEDVASAGPGNTGIGFEICVSTTDTCKTGAMGSLGGEFFVARGVATDTAGNVYVSDSTFQRIQRFDSSGNFQRVWGRDVITGGPTDFEICTVPADCKGGEIGGLGGELRSPQHLATDAAGNLYVVESINNRVQKFADPLPPASPTAPAVTTPKTKKCKKGFKLKKGKCKRKKKRK